MIEVEAMEDELCLGHEGRIACINNCKSISELTSLIRRTLAEKGYKVSDLPKLYQLALVSNIAPIEYTRQHSMLAALRVAAKSGSDMLHGAENAHSFARKLGMQTQRFGAYCCIKCIEEDLQKWNFSWYRRKHHLVGVDWCHKHGCTLFKIDSKVPFTQSPHIWLSENKLLPVNACVPKLPEKGFLNRYVEIATELLNRERPFQVENIKRCLATRSKQYYLRIGRVGKSSLISDQLFKVAPIDWLKEYLPEFNKKIPKQYFQRIDSLALYRKFAGAGDAYAIVIAVLYESAEEAFVDLSLADVIDVGTLEDKNKINKRGVQFWHGDIWMQYLIAKGKYSEMANRLCMDRTNLSMRMNDLGLPSLHDINKSPVWRAFERFMCGESAAESCAKELIKEAELEKLLRNCSARVDKAIKKIRPIVERLD